MSKKKKHEFGDKQQPERVNIVDEHGDPIAHKPHPEQSISTADDLSALQAERDDLMGRLQRLGADYQNYQKRIGKERSQEREFANEPLMKELLNVLDDMDRALAAAEENHSAADPLLVGMQLVHDKAMGVLERFGLSVIHAVGETFDPEKHSAMMQEETDSVPPMQVLRELQKGYELKGRVLRACAVVVAKAPQAPESETEEQ